MTYCGGIQYHDLNHAEREPIIHNGIIWFYHLEWFDDEFRGFWPAQTLTSADEQHCLQFSDVCSQEDLQMLVEMDFPRNERPFWDGKGKHSVPWDHESLKAKYEEWKNGNSN